MQPAGHCCLRAALSLVKQNVLGFIHFLYGKLIRSPDAWKDRQSGQLLLSSPKKMLNAVSALNAHQLGQTVNGAHNAKKVHLNFM